MQRRTRQKEILLEGLAQCSDFVSAQELHQILNQRGENIGLATVYRQLNALVNSGQVDTVRMHDQQVFRRCETDSHHHHMICEQCKKTIDVEPPIDEHWIAQMEQEHHFVVLRHVFELYGLCQECQERLRAEDEDEAAALMDAEHAAA